MIDGGSAHMCILSYALLPALAVPCPGVARRRAVDVDPAIEDHLFVAGIVGYARTVDKGRQAHFDLCPRTPIPRPHLLGLRVAVVLVDREHYHYRRRRIVHDQRLRDDRRHGLRARPAGLSQYESVTNGRREFSAAEGEGHELARDAVVCDTETVAERIVQR